MIASKPWYLSRTIWASLVTVLAGAAQLVGIPTDAVDGGQLADALLQTVTAVSGLVAILGRLRAKDRIG